jgi:hypothetical protein
MAYKEKTCLKCGVKHYKRGEYCSRSCGNSRKPTAEHKEKVAEAKREWHQTSDIAAETAYNFISQGKNKEAEPVPPQIHTPLGNRQFIEDGDLWEEC